MAGRRTKGNGRDGLDTAHAAHAMRYPMGLVRDGGRLAFWAAHPPQGDDDRLFVALVGDELVTGRHAAYWEGRTLSPSRIPETMLSVRGEEMAACLSAIGVTGTPGELPPLVESLSRELVRAWRETGAGEGHEEDSLLWEAREREQARADEAGLGVIVAALPSGLGRLVDLHGGPDAWRLVAMVRWAMARDGRVAATARLGGLASLVQASDAEEDPADHDDPAAFVLERIRRWPAGSGEGTTSAGRDEARWLVETFSATDLTVPETVLRALVRERSRIDGSLIRGPEDAAALARLVGHVAGWSFSAPGTPRLLTTLSAAAADGGYCALERDLEAAGGRRGLGSGLEWFLCEGDELRAALHASVLVPLLGRALEPLMPKGGLLPELPWDLLDGQALSAETAAVADDAVLAGRRVGDVVAAAREWDAAGRPAASRRDASWWHDLGTGSHEIGKRAHRSLPGHDAETAHAALSQFLAEVWRGEAGLARMAEACAAAAARHAPRQSAAARARSGLLTRVFGRVGRRD